MFEDSLLISQTAHIPTTKRWTIIGSVTLQCILAALIVAVPLLHPAALPFEIAAPRVISPIIPKPPTPIRVQQTSAASSSVAMPSSTPTRPLLTPRFHPGPASAPPTIAQLPFGTGTVLPNAIADSTATNPAITIRPEHPSGPVRVSQGITDGLLLTPIQPIYPAIAKTAGIHGTVIVEAIISRAGTIESLNVISGPEMLRGAAVEAIRNAKYRPYKLNGQPTDVETTITVNFKISD